MTRAARTLRSLPEGTTVATLPVQPLPIAKASDPEDLAYARSSLLGERFEIRAAYQLNANTLRVHLGDER